MEAHIGMITKYKIGDKFYGITILGIYCERYVINYNKKMPKYYGTEYYVKFHSNLYFLEEYQINTLICSQKQKFERIKQLINEFITIFLP
jgi:hypothetical protein